MQFCYIHETVSNHLLTKKTASFECPVLSRSLPTPKGCLRGDDDDDDGDGTKDDNDDDDDDDDDDVVLALEEL